MKKRNRKQKESPYEEEEQETKRTPLCIRGTGNKKKALMKKRNRKQKERPCV